MTTNIGKAFDTSKYEVVFVVIRGQNGISQIQDFIPVQYRIVYVQRSGVLQIMKELYKVIKNEHPDFVFCSMQHYNRKLLLLSNFFPYCKFIIRNANNLYVHTRLQKILMAISYPFADVIITQTEEMSEELIKAFHLKREKVVCLHNPVDVKLINEKLLKAKVIPLGTIPTKKEKIVRYIAVGRYSFEKGFDLLIDAFYLVTEHNPDSELVIVGRNDGVCEQHYRELQQKAQQYNLSDKIYFQGYTDNPYAYIVTADCFVLSSRSEGLPNVLIEAQYLGIPAAAFTCIPIIGRIVIDGETGYTAKSLDVKELSEAMLKAPRLERIESRYKSATLEDYVSLFN